MMIAVWQLLGFGVICVLILWAFRLHYIDQKITRLQEELYTVNHKLIELKYNDS